MDRVEKIIRETVRRTLINEGLMAGVKGALGKIGGDMGRAAQNGMRNAGNAAQSAVQGAGKAMQGAAQYGRDVMQAGRNGGAIQDAQNLIQGIDKMYQKYRQNLTFSQASSIRSAKSALNNLLSAFQNGDVNA